MSQALIGKPRVLVVEDEFLIRLTLVEALGDEGFDVLEAESADAALPILLGDPSIRLLLTDIQLPGALNGRSLAQRVRIDRPDLPILFITGRPDPAEEAQGSALDRYIAKPYSLNDICTTARHLAGTG